MFERFTDRARRVVVLAQEEARMLNHNYIGTEHVLLGLLRCGEDAISYKALCALGISPEGVRTQIEEIIGQGQQAPSGHIPFTPRAKKVLELSLREALQLGHNYIGTEHLLLGLIREGEGVAAQLLVKLGAELTKIRQTVIQLLNGYQGKETAEAHVRDSVEYLDAAIVETRRQKESAIDDMDFQKAADFRDDEKTLIAQRDALTQSPNRIGASGIATAIFSKPGEPDSLEEILAGVLRHYYPYINVEHVAKTIVAALELKRFPGDDKLILGKLG